MQNLGTNHGDLIEFASIFVASRACSFISVLVRQVSVRAFVLVLSGSRSSGLGCCAGLVHQSGHREDQRRPLLYVRLPQVRFASTGVGADPTGVCVVVVAQQAGFRGGRCGSNRYTARHQCRSAPGVSTAQRCALAQASAATVYHRAEHRRRVSGACFSPSAGFISVSVFFAGHRSRRCTPDRFQTVQPSAPRRCPFLLSGATACFLFLWNCQPNFWSKPGEFLAQFPARYFVCRLCVRAPS